MMMATKDIINEPIEIQARPPAASRNNQSAITAPVQPSQVIETNEESKNDISMRSASSMYSLSFAKTGAAASPT